MMYFNRVLARKGDLKITSFLDEEYDDRHIIDDLIKIMRTLNETESPADRAQN